MIRQPAPARLPASLAAALALLMAGCTTLGPDFQRPSAAVQAAWSMPDDARPATLGSDGAAWWAGFGDAKLDELLTLAQQDSPTLQSAAARISQAAAQLGVTQDSAGPQAQLSTGSSYARPDTSSLLRGKTHGSTSVQVAAQASWEVDFWGRVQRGIESDRASYFSSVAAYRAAEVSLAASVASTWMSLRTLDQRLAVERSTLVQQEENLRIARARFRLGATSELDMRQAQSQYAQTQAQLPALESSRSQALDALAILVGRTPQALAASLGDTAALAPVPAPPPLTLGMPHDLLRRRPDVVQAEWSAAAQSARIGQAQAALYPTLTLNGSFGFSVGDTGSPGVGGLFHWSQRTETLTPGLVLPIFDRGRLISQVHVQDALFEQSVLDYQQQVLKAQQEVEDALASIRGARGQIASLQTASDAARRSAELARLLYRSGQADYTTVVSAEEALLQTQDSLVQAQGSGWQGVVAAYRALGGGWDGALNAPTRQEANATAAATTTSTANSPAPPAPALSPTSR